MFLFALVLIPFSVTVEGYDNCPANTDSDFCDQIATDTDDYYMKCDEPGADLLPHPEYCTLYIQCDRENEKSSVTYCCPGYDITGDGCNNARLWFNSEKNYCDFPENVNRICSLPVANISTTTTVGISTITTAGISTMTTVGISTTTVGTSSTTIVGTSSTTTVGTSSTTTVGISSTTTVGASSTTSTTIGISTTKPTIATTIPAPCSSIGRCVAVDARNETWEESFGETATKKCPGSFPAYGYARWFCDGCTGKFEGEEPDRSDCVDHWIQEVADQVGFSLTEITVESHPILMCRYVTLTLQLRISLLLSRGISQLLVTTYTVAPLWSWLVCMGNFLTEGRGN